MKTPIGWTSQTSQKSSAKRLNREPSSASKKPDIPKDAAWLDVVSEDGEQLCDIPWNATAEEKAAVMRIVDKINGGHKVWAEVSDSEHSTIDADPDNARIHTIEFDVFYR